MYRPFVTERIKTILNKIIITCKMKLYILPICALLSVSLSAQQLYFIRATAEADYQFYELPPVQIIAYVPEQDTMLQVYKDYTDMLNQKFKRLESVIYYPKIKTVCFQTGYPYNFFLMRVHQIDTLLELTVECPLNYIAPLEIGIVDNYWIYRCVNPKAPDEDYALFKGMDFSLKHQIEMTPSDFKNLHLTGVVEQNVVLKPNDGHMYLPIVADMENRPPFSVVLPQKYWVDKETYQMILVNDEHKTIVSIKSRNPKSDEDYGRFYAAMYNKQKNTWSDVELKGNYPTMMAYGCWLAGAVQDGRGYDINFSHDKQSPGRPERDSVYIESSFDDWASNYGIYRPGILYLFNTDTEKYIEWHTGQGDSEILLVEDETVYYRVFDKIYKAAIADGERLGKPELLARDSRVVPYIHWAFTSPAALPVRKSAPFDRRHELLYAHVYQNNSLDGRSYQVQADKILDKRATLPLGYAAAEENEWVNSWKIGACNSLDISRNILTKIQAAAAGEKTGSLPIRKKVACVGTIYIDKIAYPVAVYSERDTVAGLRKVQVSGVDELRSAANRPHLRYDDSFEKYIVLAFYEEGSAEPALMLQVEKAAEHAKRSTLEEWLKFLNILQAP